MNLHGIVAPYIGAVNPNVPVCISSSIGYGKAADFTQQPTYADPVTVMAQIQPMTLKDLQQVEGINQNGVKWKIYVSGQIDGVVRPELKGGDLVDIQTGPHKGKWLVVQALEQFPDWTSAAIVLQNGG